LSTKNLSFTVKSTSGLLRVIVTDINVYIAGTNKFILIKAIWDTGATGTVITKSVAKRLGLIPTGMA